MRINLKFKKFNNTLKKKLLFIKFYDFVLFYLAVSELIDGDIKIFAAALN